MHDTIFDHVDCTCVVTSQRNMIKVDTKILKLLFHLNYLSTTTIGSNILNINYG